MFTFANVTDMMRIGERNADSVKLALKRLDVKMIAEDTGGNYGRTVELNVANGIFRIKTIDKGEKEL
jgi:chemotaxis protein CheD